MHHSTDAAAGWAEVVALDGQGRVKPGWPYRLKMDAASAYVDWLDVSPDGRLYVVTSSCGESDYSDRLLALGPDGRISH